MKHSSFLNPNQIAELKKLVNHIRNQYGPRNLIFNLIKKKKKDKQKFYNDISFSRKEIKLSYLETQDLINKKLFGVVSKREGRLTLTPKALLMMEYKNVDPDNTMCKMLDDFNKNFFEDIMGLSEELVTSTEKAIIIGLLGLDAISDQYPLTPDEKNKEYVKEVVDCAAEFLKDLGPEFVDRTLDTLWRRDVVGEGPVLGEMRRLDTIQLHTDGICKRVGGKLYLDILIDDKIEERKLTYLFKEKVFDKRPLSFPEKKKLMDTLSKIQGYGFKIFKNDPPFNTLGIRKSVRRIIESDI